MKETENLIRSIAGKIGGVCKISDKELERKEKEKERFDKHNIANCSCLTKTHEWKYHRTYCSFWKNGRIEELEKAVKSCIDLVADIQNKKVCHSYAGLVYYGDSFDKCKVDKLAKKLKTIFKNHNG